MAKPGDGATSPLGNGYGTPLAGSSGSHDFVKDPASSEGDESPRDFTKESRPTEKAKDNGGCNAESIPDGGETPFKGAPEATSGGHKPYKL